MANKKEIRPYIDICVICGENTGTILLTNAVNDDEFQKYLCAGNLCDECKKHIEDGEVGIIKVRDSSSTGNIQLAGMSIFIAKEYAKRVCTENQIKTGFALCNESIWNELFGNVEKIDNNERDNVNTSRS